MSVLPLSYGQADEPENLSLEQIVNAHESTLAQIRTANVLIKHTPVGGRPALLGYEDWYCKRGQLERFRRIARFAIPGETDPPKHLDDTLLDFGERVQKHLSSTDMAHMGQMTPTNRYGTSGYTAPFDRNLLDFQVYGYFMLRLALDASDDWRTLSELVSESKGATVKGIQRIGGHDTYEIEIIHPGIRGENAGSIMRVFVDPAAGFLVRMLRIPREPGDSNDPKAEKFELVQEISRFKDFGDGVFFPMQSDTYLLMSDGKKFAPNQFRVEEIQINEPIADEDILLTFPKNCLVNVFTQPVTPFTGGQTTDLLLMGDNGEVARTFAKNTDDYVNFLHEQSDQSSPPRSAAAHSKPNPQPQKQTEWVFIAIFAATLLVGLVMIGRRFFRSHKRS